MDKKVKHIKKILIANRGEIAVRIIKTARKMNIGTVAIFDDIEQDALHVQLADESYSLGSGTLHDTYLNIDKIISIAKSTQCDAIHPGYGFLSENETFSKTCVDNELLFIGPDARNIELMGNKIEARKFVESIGVPITQGLNGSVTEILNQAEKLNFPVLVKAAAGGGGKGMKIAYSRHELNHAVESASREASSYFGNSEVYVEQYFENPRHIEVQILGDDYGNVIHLFERECSIQRRYQKIIEEAPSPTLNNEIRKKICDTAVQIGKELGYKSAGTIEFLVDDKLNFYFLEMNTRIQVEHPVTEMVTGLDIVEQQINIATGKKLEIKQSDIKLNGHAIECRIYAEDTEKNFLPSPGQVSFYAEPKNKSYRLDASINQVSEIHGNFDPMISKLIVHANNRTQAVEEMKKSLQSYIIHGIKTNIEYLIGLLLNDHFINNTVSTQFIDKNHQKISRENADLKNIIPVILPVFGFLAYLFHNKTEHTNIWQNIGFWRNIIDIPILVNDKIHFLERIKYSNDSLNFNTNGNHFQLSNVHVLNNTIKINFENDLHEFTVSHENHKKYHVTYNGYAYTIIRNDVLLEAEFYEEQQIDSSNDSRIFAPMPGKVVKIGVKEGEEIRKGDQLIVIEAMKMENTIIAPKGGKIKKLNVKLNDSVSVTNTLLEIV